MAVRDLRIRIKNRMKERDITGKALAARIGVDPSTMSRYLRGLTTMPYDYAELICRELDIPFFADEEDDEDVDLPDFEGKNAELYRNSLIIFNARDKEQRKRIKELRYDIAEMQWKIDKKDFIIFLLAAAFIALSVWNIYFAIDANNKDWGIVQNSDGHLEFVPKVSSDYDDGSEQIEEKEETASALDSLSNT